MQVNELDYNTQMSQMALREYGRHIQRLVDHAKTIEDREERTRFAHAIVRVMGNLFPQLRDVPDFKHKLWDHLAVMANFELDIDYPYEIVRPEKLNTRPETVPYQNKGIRIRHYGRTVEQLLEKACEMPEGPERERLLMQVANHMKKSFYNVNHEVAEDAKIFEDIARLSEGRLQLDAETHHLAGVIETNAPRKPNQKNRRK